uniref:Uncharacterized protein n=1 Tax=Rhizophora mucronata TaxID=61149 RepID=A0A2P2QCD7_RHIMU
MQKQAHKKYTILESYVCQC